jgi:hypothetical protein
MDGPSRSEDSYFRDVRCRGVASIAASAAAIAAASTTTWASTPHLAGFRSASGWIVASGGKGNPTLVVAVTAPDVAAIRPVALFGSFKKLSRHGILVWTDTVGQGLAGFSGRVAWPPRLTSFRIDHGWEGQPAPNIDQLTWVGVVHGWDLDVRVFFATQRPSARLLARAQGELDRLRPPA